MESGILVTLFLLAIVFGATILTLVIYAVKHDTCATPHGRAAIDESDDDPRRPVER